MKKMRSINKGEFVVVFSGYCCDSGRFVREYCFDTFKEAQDVYSSWRKSIDNNGLGWSDGPEHMYITTKTAIARENLEYARENDPESWEIHGEEWQRSAGVWING
jgi:hypothetical protein